MILDLGLPGISGFEVLKRLRARAAKVPVLILTAADSVEQRVRGLDLGADDFMAKPFSLSELEARVRAIIRRHAGSVTPMVTIGNLSFDQAGRVARVQERNVELSAREIGLLEILIQRSGRLVSKEQIVDHLCEWGEEVSHNAIEVYVHRLRKKIEESDVVISTVRGLGYCLQRPADTRAGGAAAALGRAPRAAAAGSHPRCRPHRRPHRAPTSGAESTPRPARPAIGRPDPVGAIGHTARGSPARQPQSLRSILSDLVRTHETPANRPDWIERRRRPRVAGAERQPYQRRSLYAEILDFMFAPLALLWPVSVAVTFIVARSLADAPFDRALEERMRTLINYVEVTRSFQPPGGFNIPATLFPSSSEEPQRIPDRVLARRGARRRGGTAPTQDLRLPRTRPDQAPHRRPGAARTGGSPTPTCARRRD